MNRGLIKSQMDQDGDVDNGPEKQNESSEQPSGDILGVSLAEAQRVLYQNKVINKIAQQIINGDNPAKAIGMVVSTMSDQVKKQYPSADTKILLGFAVGTIAEIVNSLAQANVIQGSQKKNITEQAIQATIGLYMHSNGIKSDGDVDTSQIDQGQMQQMHQVIRGH